MGVVVVLAFARKSKASLRVKTKNLLGGRSLSGVLAMLTYFYAMSVPEVPFGDIATLRAVSPMLTAVGGFLLLGEGGGRLLPWALVLSFFRGRFCVRSQLQQRRVGGRIRSSMRIFLGVRKPSYARPERREPRGDHSPLFSLRNLGHGIYLALLLANALASRLDLAGRRGDAWWAGPNCVYPCLRDRKTRKGRLRRLRGRSFRPALGGALSR